MPVELSFSNGAAILTIDNSPLNLINAEVRAGIQQCIFQAVSYTHLTLPTSDLV